MSNNHLRNYSIMPEPLPDNLSVELTRAIHNLELAQGKLQLIADHVGGTGRMYSTDPIVALADVSRALAVLKRFEQLDKDARQ